MLFLFKRFYLRFDGVDLRFPCILIKCQLKSNPLDGQIHKLKSQSRIEKPEYGPKHSRLRLSLELLL